MYKPYLLFVAVLVASPSQNYQQKFKKSFSVPVISIGDSTTLGSAVAVQASAAGTNMAPSLYESFLETGANRIGLFWQ